MIRNPLHVGNLNFILLIILWNVITLLWPRLLNCQRASPKRFSGILPQNSARINTLQHGEQLSRIQKIFPSTNLRSKCTSPDVQNYIQHFFHCYTDYCQLKIENSPMEMWMGDCPQRFHWHSSTWFCPVRLIFVVGLVLESYRCANSAVLPKPLNSVNSKAGSIRLICSSCPWLQLILQAQPKIIFQTPKSERSLRFLKPSSDLLSSESEIWSWFHGFKGSPWSDSCVFLQPHLSHTHHHPKLSSFSWLFEYLDLPFLRGPRIFRSTLSPALGEGVVSGELALSLEETSISTPENPSLLGWIVWPPAS